MPLVTYVAPVNIAVVKYWGKRDESLILPLNDSISATLCTDIMCAKTTVIALPSLTENRLWLNKKEENFNSRLINCLNEIKRRAREQSGATSDFLSWNLNICSENNFPTAAGLASSAAGYACVVAALAKLYKLEGDISGLARLGSGSACRSVFGGFVQWHAGSERDGADSIATQIAPCDHWPEMRLLILVVSDRKKKTSSTNGMKNSVATSELLQHRISYCVPERIAAMKRAVLEKDFESFAEITMKESNQFHAVCMDTFPPCIYMNDASHAVVDMVHSYNEACGANRVAYTFDAGPNGCLYMLKDQVEIVFALIKKIFPSCKSHDVEYVKGIPIREISLPESLNGKIRTEPMEGDVIKYVIHTKVGKGPSEKKEVNDHLMDEAGVPKFL